MDTIKIYFLQHVLLSLKMRKREKRQRGELKRERGKGREGEHLQLVYQLHQPSQLAPPPPQTEEVITEVFDDGRGKQPGLRAGSEAGWRRVV